MAKTWNSTVAASVGTGYTVTANTENSQKTAVAATEHGPWSTSSSLALTNHESEGFEFTFRGSESVDLNGRTWGESWTGVTFVDTDLGITETGSYEFASVSSATNSVALASTTASTLSTTHTTTTGTTLTHTITTGAVSTSVWTTRNSAGTGTTSATKNTTTTTTSTQTNISTKTHTATSNTWGGTTESVLVTGPYWIGTVVEAERTEWLFAVKTSATSAGTKIVSDVMESFTSSLFAPLGATTSDVTLPVVGSDWTGLVYSTATVAASSWEVTLHATTVQTTTATSVNVTCLPPASSSYSTTFGTLSQISATLYVLGANTSSPELTAVETTSNATLTVTSATTTQTTVFYVSVNVHGGDTGILSETAATTKTFTTTLSNTVTGGMLNVVTGEDMGQTSRVCSFRYYETSDLTFQGGFTLYVPVSGRGIKLPWAIESTIPMYSNVAGISTTIPWASWAGVQRTGVTSPLTPLNMTTILDGSKTWVVSWNSVGLYATERTISTNASSVTIGTTTHSFSLAGAGALTQTWLLPQAPISTSTSNRYATAGWAVGTTLVVAGESARVWKTPGVLNVGHGTSTSRLLVTEETFESTLTTNCVTWGRETAVNLVTRAQSDTSVVAPWVKFNRNPSVIP